MAEMPMFCNDYEGVAFHQRTGIWGCRANQISQIVRITDEVCMETIPHPQGDVAKVIYKGVTCCTFPVNWYLICAVPMATYESEVAVGRVFKITGGVAEAEIAAIGRVFTILTDSMLPLVKVGDRDWEYREAEEKPIPDDVAERLAQWKAENA